MSKLTPAQVRTMRAIQRTGKTPSNTTAPLIRRLSAQGLIERSGLGLLNPATRCWSITEAGAAALRDAEIEASVKALGHRLNSIL